MTYEVVAYCVSPGCRCLDRNGIVLYRGNSAAEAKAAEGECPTGYSLQREVRPRVEGG